MFPFPQLWTFELKLIWQLNYCSRLAGKIKFKVESEIPHKKKWLFFFRVCSKTEKGKGRSNLRCQNLLQHLYCCSDIKWAGIVCGLFYPQSAKTHNWICIKTAIYGKDKPKMICWEKDNVLFLCTFSSWTRIPEIFILCFNLLSWNSRLCLSIFADIS